MCAREPRFLALFGLLLAALYHEDIVEEEDVRAWHRKPESRGTTGGAIAAGMQKCWSIGSRMVEQFDAQDSDSDADSESGSDE